MHVQLLNILFLFYSIFFIYRVESSYKYEIIFGLLPFSCVILFTYIHLIWKGASFEKLFSHGSFCLLYSSSLMFYLIIFGLFIYEEQLHPVPERQTPLFEVLFVRFYSAFMISWFLGSYVYYGCFSGKFTYED